MVGHPRFRFGKPVIFFVMAQSFLSASAFAAGFQINEVSPSLQGSATAGAAATSDDVSAMFANPATLSTLKRNQAYLGASEIFPNARMTDASAVHTVNTPGLPPSSITAPVQGVNAQNNISKPAFVPDGYLSWRFNDKLVGGLAVVAPFGLTTKYYGNSVVRFMAVDSAVSTIDINPALAYAITDKWSLGLGLQVQYMEATFSNFNGPYTGVPAVDALIAADNPTYLKASGWGYGYTLGVLFQPDAATRYGIGYRSQVSEQLSGRGQQYTSPGGVTPAPSPSFLYNASTSVNGSMRTPAVLIMSAAHDIYDWTLKATAQLNFWESFDHLSINMPDAFATNSTIQTKWKNAWFTAVGADYRLSPTWTLRGGVAYDQTPTNNAYRDPRIPDSDRIWTDIGATYYATKNISIDGAFAHVFMKDQSVNVTQASGTNATSNGPLEVNQVSAKFKGSVDIVSLAIRYSF